MIYSVHVWDYQLLKLILTIQIERFRPAGVGRFSLGNGSLRR